MDDRLLNDFLAEAEDLIEELHGDVAALRAHRGNGRARRELVARIFRQVHTIKGSSSAAGLDATGEMAHEFESLLDAVRAGRVAVGEEVLEAFEQAVNAIAAGLDAATRGARTDIPPQLVARIRRLASSEEGAASADDSEVEMLLPAEAARLLGAHERQRLREAVGEGARAYVVEASFDLATFDEEYRRLSDALGESGEVISTQPFVDADAPERVCFRIVYASAEPRDEASACVARLGARLSGAGDDEHDDEMVADDEELQPVAPLPSRLVRVPLEEIDELITSARALFAEALGALELAIAGSASGDERAELETRAAHIRRGFSELEGRLKGLRVVPLRAMLLRAASAGESVARAAGKSVEFETAGSEVMLDRSLAARVAESLLHLIRNAVDHGIEDTHERRAAGKRERGRISVEAFTEEGSVVLRVSDDGRGIDPESVARAAAEREPLPRGSSLTDEQAQRMIFRPGFSTAERVTLVSGRGVGLDVVERAVKEMGGEVSVRSERGRGTVFEMRLPST